MTESTAAIESHPGIRVGWAGWALVAVFAATLLTPLVAAWRNAQDLGHGWAVPILIAYLYWERWDSRPAGLPRDCRPNWWWPVAAMLVLLALPLRLVLTPFPLWPVPLAAYVGVLAVGALVGAWLAAGAAGARWVGGPLILLAGAVPWPSIVEANVISPLRIGLAAVTAEICYLLGVSALAVGTTLRLAQSWVGVDETCGGMRSLQAAVMAALFFGEWLRLAWPRRIVLVVIGVGAAIFGNFLRILVLVWRANEGGDAALQAAHDAAGWLALGTSLLLIGLAARKMRPAGFTPPPSAARDLPRGTLPRPALIGIAVLVLGLGANELATRWWYQRGEEQRIGTVPQWGVVFPQGATRFRSVPLADVARDMLRPDFFAAGEWFDSDQNPVSAYYVEWQRGQAARSIPFLHNPTVCLPMSGCELVRPLGRLSIPWAGGVIPFHAFVFRRSGEEFAVAFGIWDPSRGRSLENEAVGWRGWMATQLSDVREARVHQPAQLLSVAVWGPRAKEKLAGSVSALVSKREARAARPL